MQAGKAGNAASGTPSPLVGEGWGEVQNQNQHRRGLPGSKLLSFASPK